MSLWSVVVVPCFTRKNVRRRGFEVKCKLLVRIYSKWFCPRSVRTRFRSAHTFLKDCLSAIKMAVHAEVVLFPGMVMKCTIL